MSDDDDLDDDFDLEEEGGGFEDFQGGNTLGDLWRNNPLVKVGTILAGLAVVVGGIVLFGGPSEQAVTSRVRPPADVTEAPGTSEVSETYRQAIEERNIEETERALREQESVLPIPTEPQLGRLPVPTDQGNRDDPLERWRLLQAERKRAQDQQRRQQQFQANLNNQGPDPAEAARQQAVNALANSMAQQMESILDAQGLRGSQTRLITSPDFIETSAAGGGFGSGGAAGGAIDAETIAQLQAAGFTPEEIAQIVGDAPVEDVAEIVVPAGTIEFAQLITESNTDAPGPVLAQIMSGPLQGSRILGSFEATNDFLILSFSTIVVDGISQAANAVALDPAKANPGVITEVDKRYFKRVVLPAAAAFVEGLATAISDSGTTTITINDDTVSEETADRNSDQEVASGVAELGQELGDLLDEEANQTRPLLRVAAGTPVGILFLEPVFDNPQ